MEPDAPGTLDRSPPAHLTEGQRESWQFALEHAPVSILRRIDRGMLVSWVILEDLLQRANIELERSDRDAEFPLLATARGGGVGINPYVVIIERCTRGMAKLASELGFSPASRPRITGGTALPDQPSPTAAVSAFARIKAAHERRRSASPSQTIQ